MRDHQTFCKGASLSEFSVAIFSALDDDADRKMDFSEFLAGCCKLCSCDHENLCRFAFRMVDKDMSGGVDWSEVENLAKVIHGAQAETFIESLTRAFEKHTDVKRNLGQRRLTVEQFIESAKSFTKLVEPVITLQKSLKNKVVGTRFWDSRTPALREHFAALKAGGHSLADLKTTHTGEDVWGTPAARNSKVQPQCDAGATSHLEKLYTGTSFDKSFDSAAAVKAHRAHRAPTHTAALFTF
jgi:Ca2+-binding EF-hand superfamily protein